MTVSLVCIPLLYGTHKCHELSRNDPVDITIFDSLIELIFFDIECPELVPLEFDSILQPLKTLQHSALVQAVAFACISVRFEKTMIWPEHIPSFFCRALQNNDHEGTHEEGTIHDFVPWILGRAVVEDFVFREVFIA